MCIRWSLLAGMALWAGAGTGCKGDVPAATSEALAPGVLHHEIYLLEGPWSIHLIEIDLPRAWRAGIRLRTVKADPALGGEKTSGMAGDAIAAINGDFFYASGRTAGMQIRDGVLLQEPRSRSAFAITADGKPLIAVFKLEAGLVTGSGQTLRISAFNENSVVRQPTRYSPLAQAWQDSVRAEIGFQLQILGRDLATDDTVSARVLQVRRRAWPLRLDEGQLLVALGSGHALADQISPGDTVLLYNRLPPATQDLRQAIGGGPRIVRDGAVSVEYEREHLDFSFATDRDPRTAVGYSRDRRTLFLVTVDGGQPGYSVGMSLAELGDLMAHRLVEFSAARANAHQAMNLDGGGSTTMVVQRQLANRPSDPIGERTVGNALLVVPPAYPGTDPGRSQ